MFQAAMISVICLLLMGSAVESAHVRTSDQLGSTHQAVPSDTLITFERSGSACEGVCPTYKLTIAADGTVVYLGKQFVRKKGLVKSKITLEQLSELISEFDKANYFFLRDRYTFSEDGCAAVWLDMASTITSIRINGRSKRIFHNTGCREKSLDGAPGPVYPKELQDLEDRIDKIVGTSQWTK